MTVIQNNLPTLGASDFDRVMVVFSDIEMGSGGDLDDFPHSQFMGELLLSYLNEAYERVPIDFVFNGDTFDLLKTPYQKEYPHHITSNVAIAKMASVAAAHPKFFEAIRRILDHPDGNKSVHFVTGNHDTEIIFPEVQDFIHALCSCHKRANFPGFHMELGPVYLEHGSQLDPLFYVDPKNVFVTSKGENCLNISWAMIALLDVFMPLYPLFYFYDRLNPKDLLLELVPEAKELLMAKAWKYWTKDFWRDFLLMKDPLLKFNWVVLRETIKRFTTGNTNVYINENWLKNIVGMKPQELFIMGHLHKTASYHYESKRILQSGCLRDEYFISKDGKSFQPTLKGYYEVFLKSDHVVGIVTKEFNGPPRPAESFPDSIFDMVPKLKELLGTFGDLKKSEKEQKKQELEEEGQAEEK